MTPSERGKSRLAGGEGFVKQAEDRCGQQNDERPNHAPDHSLHNVNAGGLGVNAGGLGVNPRVDFGKPRLHLGPQLGVLELQLRLQLGDLSSNDSDDVLPAQTPDFLDGGMNQVGVRLGAAQNAIDGVGSGFSGHNRTPL